ncbi:RDD family protein [Segniliparus rotundus]|nr:RDD family protein [Segniliparus rotundus]
MAGKPRTSSSPAGPRPQIATWGQRAGACLIDFLILLPFVVLDEMVKAHMASSGLYAGTSGGAAVASALLMLGLMVVWIWNVVVQQGRTGQTVGKETMKIRLVGASSGEPVGKGRCFARQTAHLLDALPLFTGYLWPLWDENRQTFADKAARTVVVQM